MAVVYPTAAGNWSTRTWNDDATGSAYSGGTPQTGDTVLTNNVTITMDQNITIAEIANRAGTNAAAGGTLDCPNGANGLTLTSEVVGNRADSVVTVSMSSPNTMTITRDITGATGTGSVNGAYGVVLSGTGQLTINGNIAGGIGQLRHGLIVTAAGTLIVNGNLTTNITNTHGISMGTAANGATVTINGNATGGNSVTSNGLLSSADSTTTITVNGTAIHGASALSSVRTEGVAALGGGFITIQKAAYNGAFGPGFTGRIRFADVNDPDLIEVVNAAGTTVKATAGAKGKPNLRGGFAN
jgi:hypothetical protein